jgi:hypothetical protein
VSGRTDVVLPAGRRCMLLPLSLIQLNGEISPCLAAGADI